MYFSTYRSSIDVNPYHIVYGSIFIRVQFFYEDRFQLGSRFRELGLIAISKSYLTCFATTKTRNYIQEVGMAKQSTDSLQGKTK